MSYYSALEHFKNKQKAFCRYGRDHLGGSEIKLYDKLCEAFLSYSDSVPVFGLNAERIAAVFDLVKLENPHLFFVESLSYKYTPVINVGTVIPKYRFRKEAAEATLSEILNACSKVINLCNGKSELEREIIVHDYLCQSTKYDYSMAASSFECVGPILFGKGVCEGISKASKLLFDLQGISSLVIRGRSSHPFQNGRFSDSSHAWNIVCIDNVFYHLDITFDMCVQFSNTVRYDYFNLSDAEIMRDHEINTDFHPECNCSGNYYRSHRMFMCSPKEFQVYVHECISREKSDIVFQLPISRSLESAKRIIFDIIQDEQSKKRKKYQLACNETQWVFQLHAIN